MKQFWYRRKNTSVIYSIQGLLAGLVVLCALSLLQWTEGSLSLGDMGRRFEHTGIFLHTVEQIVRDKLTGTMNRDLFEDGGEYAPDKRIDIRQYASGSLDQSSQNPGTSYRIEDLVSFGQSGAANMQMRIMQLLSASPDEQKAGDALMQEAAELEEILPSSGMLLADYAKVNSNASLAVLEYYRNLSETAIDIAARYAQYVRADEEQSVEAPSNVRYYVENTSTKKRYTNMEATTLSQASGLLEADKAMTFIFEGERRFNIMVVDPDKVQSDRASQWFSETNLVGSNEKLVIAVDLSFPVSDSLESAYRDYQRRKPMMMAALIALAAGGLAMFILLVLSILLTGRAKKNGMAEVYGVDLLPTEIEAGIAVILLIFWGLFASQIMRTLGAAHPRARLWAGAFLGMMQYWIGLFFLLSLVRRIKAKTLWKNSVAYYVVQGSRQVISARKRSQRLFAGYISLIVLNLVALMIGGVPGTLVFLVLNLAALLYLMRDTVGGQNVREGLQQISTGKLDYRIREDVLTGESREMAAAVNEMGEGLEKAVAAMLKGERLKAELITNVSHDLKTPLTSIINYVDILDRLPDDDPRRREYLGILKQKTQRLKTLTEDLIEVSKISSGNIELHPMKLVLQEFLWQAVGEFEDRFEEKALTLAMDLPKERLYIEADGSQLWRVFENLLSNIAKYAKPGTQVHAQVYRNGEQVRIIFANEPQIPITVSAEQLLERFSRGDASRTSEGSGLGLSIAKSLIELMGGQFVLETQERLFRVCVTFPLDSVSTEQKID